MGGSFQGAHEGIKGCCGMCVSVRVVDVLVGACACRHNTRLSPFFCADMTDVGRATALAMPWPDKENLGEGRTQRRPREAYIGAMKGGVRWCVWARTTWKKESASAEVSLVFLSSSSSFGGEGKPQDPTRKEKGLPAWPAKTHQAARSTRCGGGRRRLDLGKASMRHHLVRVHHYVFSSAPRNLARRAGACQR